MKSTKQKRKNAQSRGKLALIGVLALVMLTVWGNALIGGGKARPTREARAQRPSTGRPTANATPRPAVATKANDEVRKPLPQWPVLPLATAIQNDPFGKPGWAIAPAPSSTAATASSVLSLNLATAQRSQLEQIGASAIVISEEEKIATVGDLEIRVGDRIGGFVVLDITPTGVVVGQQTR